QSIRAVLAPSAALATFGVLVTALITAPVAKYALGIGWAEALLVGAVVGSTDAAAVFLLVHSQGLRLRPRVGATLE
ncbi:cation:proton antiporter, partial [Klebsiella pneumoniae]|nr:cation:proton antiporter [Klebsiella pneumoniae]